MTSLLSAINRPLNEWMNEWMTSVLSASSQSAPKRAKSDVIHCAHTDWLLGAISQSLCVFMTSIALHRSCISLPTTKNKKNIIDKFAHKSSLVNFWSTTKRLLGTLPGLTADQNRTNRTIFKLINCFFQFDNSVGLLVLVLYKIILNCFSDIFNFQIQFVNL